MLLFCQLHEFYFHHSYDVHSCIVSHALHFPLQKQKRKQKKEQKDVMKVYTTCLVTCVGYHDDGYEPTMLGLYTRFCKKNY